jgi:hypothetical protein
VFLTRPLPRAFLVATNGGFTAGVTGFDPLGRAAGNCRAAHLVCRPYAVDDAVVWVPPPPPVLPPATHFAALADVAAVPWVDTTSRAAYVKFLALKLPRAFAVASSGSSVSTQGGYDPLARALALCRAHGLACRPYAVDEQVVWSPPAR